MTKLFGKNMIFWLKSLWFEYDYGILYQAEELGGVKKTQDRKLRVVEVMPPAG